MKMLKNPKYLKFVINDGHIEVKGSKAPNLVKNRASMVVIYDI
ncbi:MAG: hypothetical protein OXC46_03520 [Thaumarchaeota archaeon]|nr:hypothetical protein [Nitrososphaerota archaeon]